MTFRNRTRRRVVPQGDRDGRGAPHTGPVKEPDREPVERAQESPMREPSTPQKLASEVIGTAFLVFIGVGSVPATLIVNGQAPFTMADLGVISLAFGTVVVATVYALGHVSGNHINPAVTLGLAATGKFPWRDVPAYLAAQVVGATIGA